MDIDTSERPLRRDAERNRERIVEAARKVFAERGLEVSMDDIAEAAGVGVGTVYRRFPERETLVQALFDQRLDEVTATVRQAAADPDAWRGLVWFLESSLETEVGDRGLAELIRCDSTAVPVCEMRERIAPLLTDMVRRARDAGQARPDLEASDLGVLKLMILDLAYRTRDFAPDAWRRYLALALDGLRAGPGTAQLPAPAISVDQLPEAFVAHRRRGG